MALEGYCQALKVFGRSAPAGELSQGRRRLLRGTGELAAGLGEPRIQVAGLAGLADHAAERFDVLRFFQVGELLLLSLDLVLMTGDRLPRLFRLAAKLGELLSQSADDRRLIGAEPQRLGLVQVGRAAQVAEDPPRLVLGVAQKVIQPLHAVFFPLLHHAQAFPHRFDLVGGVEQYPGRVEPS